MTTMATQQFYELYRGSRLVSLMPAVAGAMNLIRESDY